MKTYIQRNATVQAVQFTEELVRAYIEWHMKEQNEGGAGDPPPLPAGVTYNQAGHFVLEVGNGETLRPLIGSYLVYDAGGVTMIPQADFEARYSDGPSQVERDALLTKLADSHANMITERDAQMAEASKLRADYHDVLAERDAFQAANTMLARELEAMKTPPPAPPETPATEPEPALAVRKVPRK